MPHQLILHFKKRKEKKKKGTQLPCIFAFKGLFLRLQMCNYNKKDEGPIHLKYPQHTRSFLN